MVAVLKAASGADFAQTLVDRAIARGADAAQAENIGGEYFELDADTRRVNLARTTFSDETSLTAFQDGKKGSASLTGRDDADVENAVASALEAAAIGVADDANQIATAQPMAPSEHGPHAADRAMMTDAVLAHLAYVAEHHPQILTRHATYAFENRTRSFVNSGGVHQSERRGSYNFGTLIAAKAGEKSTSFNYSGASSYEPFTPLLGAGSVRRLMEELIQSFDPQPVPQKFVGDVVITPDCLSSLMGTISGALQGYALMAETTPYKGRKGEAIASACFSLENAPRADDFPGGADFDDYGVPTRDLGVISDGVLNEFLVDFYCSKKLGTAQTAGRRNLIVASGDKSIEQIIADTERGILFARFSGGQPNNNLDFSGIAKNSFYIEDGEIRFALIETMVSGNLQELLLNIHAVSSESVNFGASRYPYVAASGVTISGK